MGVAIKGLTSGEQGDHPRCRYVAYLGSSSPTNRLAITGAGTSWQEVGEPTLPDLLSAPEIGVRPGVTVYHLLVGKAVLSTTVYRLGVGPLPLTSQIDAFAAR